MAPLVNLHLWLRSSRRCAHHATFVMFSRVKAANWCSSALATPLRQPSAIDADMGRGRCHLPLSPLLQRSLARRTPERPLVCRGFEPYRCPRDRPAHHELSHPVQPKERAAIAPVIRTILFSMFTSPSWFSICSYCSYYGCGRREDTSGSNFFKLQSKGGAVTLPLQ